MQVLVIYVHEKNAYSLEMKPALATSLVSEGTSLSGDLKFEKELVVAGSVNGSITCSGDDKGVVKILDGGALIGEINSPMIEIFGKVEATITGTSSIVIGPSANVTGTVRYQKLEVSPGAIINGELVPISELKDIHPLSEEIDEVIKSTTKK